MRLIDNQTYLLRTWPAIPKRLALSRSLKLNLSGAGNGEYEVNNAMGNDRRF